MEHELSLRLILIKPPPAVKFGLRRRKTELLSPTQTTADQLIFDLSVRVRDNRPDGWPNFLGLYTEGRAANRFLAITSGALAGQTDSCWTRGAKVPLSGISWRTIREALATPGAIIEGRIAGTAKDGGPACATVPLLAPGWRVLIERGPVLARWHSR